MCARNDSVLLLEKSKSLGIDKGTLLKHIELQELAWFGGDFRDDQSIPQYEPTETDFLLSIPLVEYYLATHGYKTFFKAISRKGQVCLWNSVENG